MPQATQRRDAVLYEFRGERLCLPEIARRVGMKHITLYQRIKRGLLLEDAASLPVRRYGGERS